MERKPACGVKLERMLLHRTGKAIGDFSLIKPGDRVAVALSGGKDSFSLLRLLSLLQRRSPVRYDLIAVTVHNGSEGFRWDLMEAYLRREGHAFHLEKTEIVNVVEEKRRPGSPYCSLCARLRRGALYGAALALGCDKLALGHHLDDAIETLLLNLFFNGRAAALPPVLVSDSGHVPILRPLLYCTEADLDAYVRRLGLEAVGCACPVCPTHPEHEFSDLKRKRVRAWIETLAAGIPNLRETARAALRSLEPERFFGFQKSTRPIAK
jgi:tRNA 2-thiocytidine biosynthesis protein TtcA